MLIVAAVVTVAVLLGTLFGAYVVYDRHCIGRGGKRRSFILFLLGAVLCTYFGAAITAAFIAEAQCMGEGVGCMVGAVLIAFPTVGLGSLAAYLFFWARSGDRKQPQ
jgi:hypothetical protein